MDKLKHGSSSVNGMDYKHGVLEDISLHINTYTHQLAHTKGH